MNLQWWDPRPAWLCTCGAGHSSNNPDCPMNDYEPEEE